MKEACERGDDSGLIVRRRDQVLLMPANRYSPESAPRSPIRAREFGAVDRRRNLTVSIPLGRGQRSELAGEVLRCLHVLEWCCDNTYQRRRSQDGTPGSDDQNGREDWQTPAHGPNVTLHTRFSNPRPPGIETTDGQGAPRRARPRGEARRTRCDPI